MVTTGKVLWNAISECVMQTLFCSVTFMCRTNISEEEKASLLLSSGLEGWEAEGMKKKY